ncbi:MAG: DUF397 domain-containing protein [Acidimicrobiia bacterium]
MTELAWQKSSFSSGDGNTTCIEIASGPCSLRLRESEDPETVLAPDRRTLAALLGRLKAEAFDIR